MPAGTPPRTIFQAHSPQFSLGEPFSNCDFQSTCIRMTLDTLQKLTSLGPNPDLLGMCIHESAIFTSPLCDYWVSKA